MHVDWERIETFASEDNLEDMEWLRGMMKTLSENMLARLAEVETMISSNSTNGYLPLLHQLKGVTANFGLDELNKLIISAESLGKSGNFKGSMDESLKFRQIWEDTKVELKKKFSDI